MRINSFFSHITIFKGLIPGTDLIQWQNSVVCYNNNSFSRNLRTVTPLSALRRSFGGYKLKDFITIQVISLDENYC